MGRKMLANRLAHGFQESSNNETQTPTPVSLSKTEVNEKIVAPITVRKRGCTQSQYDLRERLATNMQESRSQPVDGKKKRKMEAEEQTEIDEEHTQAEQTQAEQTQPIGSNRCNLQSICRLLKDTKLSDRHIASLKKTPFWLLFEAIMNSKLLSDNCRKYDEVVLKIIQSYEEESKSFIVGDRQLKLTKEHVKLILGISCGEVEMVETNVKKENVALAKRLGMKEARLLAPAMKQKIKELTSSEKEQDVEDVVRLLCLYLCVTLFFSNQGTTVNWSYVQHMEDLETVKQYDWAEAIRKYLLMSVHNNHKELKGLRGSTVLLLYWLCEHTKLVEVKKPNAIPRVVKWKISDLRKSLKDFGQLSQLPGDKVNHTEVQETAEERKIFDEISGGHGDEQGQVSEQGEAKMEIEKQMEIEKDEVKNDDFVELVEAQFEVQQDEGEKVEFAEVENVPDSCGLDDFDTPTDLFQSPLRSCEIGETQPVSFRRDEVTSPKYNSDSTLEPNTLSGKSLPQEEDECLKKLVDNILDDSKQYAQNEYLEKQMEIEKQSNKDALAMIDELRKEKDSITNDMSTKIERLENEKKQMEIEKESICEPLNDEIAKLKKLVESQDKQIVMLKDVMSKGPLTTMHELKNQKQSLEKDLIEKVESLEEEKKQLELEKLKMQEDNDIVLQSKDHQITTLARKIEETEEEMKNQIQNVDKQNKKLCLAKDRYIQTLLNKASVLKQQKAKQQDVNNELQMQIDEFKIHEVTQRYADETEGAVHQVTQNATLEKIRRLEREKEELELELIDIRVHEKRQKRKAEISLISPKSNIIALKARERKKNTDVDFVYEEVKKKTKTGKELFIDVDDLKSQEDEREKKELRKLKANAEVPKLLSRESWMAIETLWNTADVSTKVWSSKDELMHVTVDDIQTLLFESALSTRCVDGYMNILMQQHVDQQPTFILETQPAKSFVFPSFLVLVLNDKQPIKVKRVLDKMMPKAVHATFLLFPIIHQFHWTLLVLHKDEGKWIFYNSLFKGGHRKDIYCETTNNLRKIIADYINSHYKSSAGEGIGNTVHIERSSPQQPDGFVECGVVVIFLMKQYLMNQERSKVISIEECRKTRAEMILAFLSDQSNSSTSKVPQTVQNLKQIAESSKALVPQFKHYQLRVKQGPKIK